MSAYADILSGSSLDGIDLSDRAHALKLARSLHLMNVSAVCQRYPDDTPDEYPMPDVSAGLPPTPVQFYKSLSCYLYQCSEGNVDRRVLYRDLKRVAANLAENIVGNTAEYQSAKWG